MGIKNKSLFVFCLISFANNLSCNLKTLEIIEIMSSAARSNHVIHCDIDIEGGLFLCLVISSTSLALVQTFLYRILGQVSYT